MIIIDTNVLSAAMLDRPDIIAVNWLEQQRTAELWITAITIFELHFGIELLPIGKRRSQLETAAADLLERLFYSRILMIDSSAAREAARLAAFRQRKGIIIGTNDTLIAGIAIANRAVIATRNVRHFSDVEVKVTNPWED